MIERVKVGSLCTGYGGLELGLGIAGVDVDLRWLAEVDPALDPLHPPSVPNLGDISAVDWSAVEPVDLVTAGFPCQPISTAGRQRGDADERWLWPHVMACLTALRPARVLLENVRNLVSIRKGELWAGILDDLGQAGYSVRWLTIGACHVGAAHHRHRVFALATQVGYETDEVERIATTSCGAKGAGAVPTPTVSDSRNSRNATAGRATAGHHSGVTLSDFAQLLLTPTAISYGANQGGAAGRVGPVRHSLDSMARHDLLPTPRASDHEFGGRQLMSDGRTPSGYEADLIDLAASRLLPTPTTRDGDGRGTGDAMFWAERATRRTNGMPLDSTVALLPTPRASDGVNGGPGQRGSSGDLAMSSAVQPEHWGRFAAAVTRHAARYGPPPAPTEPNSNGNPRLSAAFAEWLMCLPAGHVTGRLDRKAALKAVGNGVCPSQAAAAWDLLTGAITIDTSLGRSVRSRAMTTNTEIREIQDREALARGRVIAAGVECFTSEDPDTAANHAARIIQAAMMELAAVWREQAEWWKTSGKRGGKGTAEQLTQAAGRLAGFAVGLTTRPVEPPTPEKANGCEHPGEALSQIKSGDVKCTACYPPPHLAADLFIDEAAVQEEVANLEAERAAETPIMIGPDEELPGETDNDTQEKPVSTPSPVQAIIDSPFISPGGPGARPAVTALSYSLLPVIANQLDPRTELSHSFVETYETCSLKSMLQRASRHNLIGPQRPSWSLIGGKAFHAAVEAVERDALAFPGRVPISSKSIAAGLPGGASADPAQALHVIVAVDEVWAAALDAQVKAASESVAGSAYADPGTWHASNSGKEGYDWWRIEGAMMLHRYLEFHDADWRSARRLLHVQPLLGVTATPVLEQHFVTSVMPDAAAGTSALTTSGYIDATWLYSDGADRMFLDIVDWKTGSRRPVSTFQLGEYAHGLAPLLPPGLAAVPVRGSYWLARKGEYTPPVLLLDKHPAEEMTYRYRQVALGSSLGIATPNVSDMCVACSVRDYCPAQASR